jgi:hypothetical protein
MEELKKEISRFFLRKKRIREINENIQHIALLQGDIFFAKDGYFYRYLAAFDKYC